jgi:hypothetical protein
MTVHDSIRGEKRQHRPRTALERTRPMTIIFSERHWLINSEDTGWPRLRFSLRLSKSLISSLSHNLGPNQNLCGPTYPWPVPISQYLSEAGRDDQIAPIHFCMLTPYTLIHFLRLSIILNCWLSLFSKALICVNIL